MDALGGTCDVLNRDDGCQGSVFGFSFPYRPDPQLHSPQFIESQKSVLHHASMSESSCSESKDDGDDIEDMSLKGFLLESQRDSKRLLSTTTSMPPLRILVVDDSPSIMKVTKRFLTEHGHTVDTAENGSEALTKLKQVRAGGTSNVSIYDMMLTDIQMPVMDGMECTKRCRQWESEGSVAIATTSKLSKGAKSEKSEGHSVRSSRLLIVGMSANNDDEVAREGLIAGMDGFIGKVLISL